MPIQNVDRTQGTTETEPMLHRPAQFVFGQQRQENVFMDRGSVDAAEPIGRTGPVQVTDVDLRHSEWVRKALTHLTDYVRYSACSTDPSSTTSSCQDSSSTSYPIVNIVICNNFSSTH